MQAPEAAPVPPPPSPQANQLVECPPLPQAQSSLMPALLANHDQVAQLYNQCRTDHSSLINAVKEWERTAWDWYCAAAERVGAPVDGCAEVRTPGPDPPNR